MRIGIDLMGSDTSPQVLFEAVLQAVQEFDASKIFLVFATKEVVDALLSLYPQFSRPKSRIEFKVVTEVITMSDAPIRAIRTKKNSSLVIGIRLMRKRKIDALVSAGNTGALIASATISLSRLPGISRPALLALLPTKKGTVAVVDVGGNVSCKAQHLIQFAHLGAAYQRCMLGIDSPSVGLLNIGAESRKGTAEVQQAYQILKDLNIQTLAEGLTLRMHFVGNVEGRDVFQGQVDVLVTNGFTGNVLLKSTEGVASFIFDYILSDFQTNPAVQTSLKKTQQYFNYAEYPGAILCGVDGVVVKCHGDSSAQAMFSGIKGAIHLVEKNLIKKIKEHL